jgi:acyl-CoA thioesterase
VARDFARENKGFNPFGDLVGLTFSACERGYSLCALEVKPDLLNPHNTVHGGVIYTLADTGMGAALYPYLGEGELCATIEIKIVYFAQVASGPIVCETRVIHKGGNIAVLESEITNRDNRVAKAVGTFSVYSAKRHEKILRSDSSVPSQDRP